ncbi:ATP-grasp fold, subdomain 1 [Penicillium griseofulvum]|uniref:ATP-grasp fold, subdomain 1 n=1 Tax=Penicillium patulum TaxID=5078 RepID=A0A135LUR7_PENPA|nr:ATP-grasp fold, subdomain 1 [Penicillium griseofulvum]KXG52696.1 ATP-grasp fold, subdomain 1 [Penicillium griseofulvum]
MEDSSGATWAWKLDILPEETTTIVLNIYPKNISDSSTKSATEGSARDDAATQFLLEHLPKGNGLVKLLLPLQSGYIVQSDFLERRMVDCLNVTKLQGFVTPGQHIRGHIAEVYHGMSISSLLSYSYGAIVVQNDSSLSVEMMSTAINDQLVKRLSFPWLSSTPIPRKRLALVGAGSLIKAEGYLLAAASLNIAMVVFDEPSHWLSDNTYSHLREDFVPLDMAMAIDTDMVHRITAALKKYQNNMEEKPLDGVMSLDERLHTIIAHVATQLDFNTSPPESVGLVQNKFKARQLDTNIFCRLIRSPEDLEKMLSKDGPQLPYPLIIKPAKGWCSEGVWKVANEQELREKVHLLWRESFTAWHGTEVVIETYVEGPEIDANIVLVDGEMVVFEVNDDFPSTGDYNESGARVQNFVETSNMLPSALPPYELQSVKQRLHELALAAGFRNAILHIEAKLRNSSCHYTQTDSDGLIDLELKTPATTTTQPKDVFLIEINPRAPGWQEVEAAARTYGVCYYSISLLNALADKERIVSLSKPFLGGPQYHMQLLYVSAQKGGIYKFGDICKKVLQAPSQEHQLSAHIVKSANLLKDGEEVLDPSTGQVFDTFIGIFLVISRKSRKEAMRIGHEIERLVREYTDWF